MHEVNRSRGRVRYGTGSKNEPAQSNWERFTLFCKTWALRVCNHRQNHPTTVEYISRRSLPGKQDSIGAETMGTQMIVIKW